MLVKTLIGRYAGDIIDMTPHIAHQQIRLGRALDVRELSRPAEASPQARTTRRKRKPRQQSTAKAQ